jgi:hypothetical protein
MSLLAVRCLFAVAMFIVVCSQFAGIYLQWVVYCSVFIVARSKSSGVYLQWAAVVLGRLCSWKNLHGHGFSGGRGQKTMVRG